MDGMNWEFWGYTGKFLESQGASGKAPRVELTHELIQFISHIYEVTQLAFISMPLNPYLLMCMYQYCMLIYILYGHKGVLRQIKVCVHRHEKPIPSYIQTNYCSELLENYYPSDPVITGLRSMTETQKLWENRFYTRTFKGQHVKKFVVLTSLEGNHT